jgi:hypothetical protein
VTVKGVEGLVTALPKCKITWDGVIEPNYGCDFDSRTAEAKAIRRPRFGSMTPSRRSMRSVVDHPVC